MNSTFLFSLFLVGLIIATLQDIKRREIDDWLNLFLFFSGTAFLIFSLNGSYLLSYAFFVFVLFLVCTLLYFARFFAGGDTKLLFAMAPVFFSLSFLDSFKNFFIFFFCLLVMGAIYGIFYILFLCIKNHKKVFNEVRLNLKRSKFLRFLGLILAILLVAGFIDNLFFVFFSLGLLFIFLFLLGKALEKVSFIVKKSPFKLAEGDWLLKNINVGKKIIRSSWDGLTKEDILLLKKYRKAVYVREGIPYAPVFLLAFVVYLFVLANKITFLKEALLILSR